MVSILINHELHYWNRTMLRELFGPESIQAILRIPIPLSPKLDELIWVKVSKGAFSVKFAYRVDQEDTPNSILFTIPWQKIWSLKVLKRREGSSLR